MVGVEAALYVNEDEPGNVTPLDTTETVADDELDPCGGMRH